MYETCYHSPLEELEFEQQLFDFLVGTAKRSELMRAYSFGSGESIHEALFKGAMEETVELIGQLLISERSFPVAWRNENGDEHRGELKSLAFMSDGKKPGWHFMVITTDSSNRGPRFIVFDQLVKFGQIEVVQTQLPSSS